MAQIIQAQALIPLNLHVSGLPGTGLNIEAVSFGQGSNVFSFNAAPVAAPEHAQASQNNLNVQSFESDSSEDVNVAADLIDFIQPTTPPEGCPNHAPEAYLIGDAPRMIYVKSFLTEDERQHILTKTENQYTPAYVYKPGSDTPDTDETFRKSETAVVERDPVIQCIEYRAKHLQQKWTNMALEPLTVQRYQKGGFFDYHLDGFQGTSLPNRKSTFNVWLDGNCTGGGTHFPSIPRYEDPSLCTYLDCNMPADNGTVFRPIAGNAVFWESISDDGHVYLETVHAGLPVEEGTKIGLNIWTWEFAPGDPRSRSSDSNAFEAPCSSCS